MRRAHWMQNADYPIEPERLYISNPSARSAPRGKKKPPKIELPLGSFEALRVRVALVRDDDWEGPTLQVRCSDDAYAAVKTLEVEPVEAIYVMLLDTQNYVIGICEVARGGLHSAAVEMMPVLQPVILAGASALMLVHNHPSGKPAPSREDQDFTERVQAACRIMGVRLLDHLIVGRKSYVSLANEGMI